MVKPIRPDNPWRTSMHVAWGVLVWNCLLSIRTSTFGPLTPGEFAAAALGALAALVICWLMHVHVKWTGAREECGGNEHRRPKPTPAPPRKQYFANENPNPAPSAHPPVIQTRVHPIDPRQHPNRIIFKCDCDIPRTAEEYSCGTVGCMRCGRTLNWTTEKREYVK